METMGAKVERKARVAAVSARLHARNLRSDEPVVNEHVPGVVSLTTYGRRVRQVHLTIESVGAGEVKPGRMILWLDPEQYADPPATLRRLQARGLELRQAPAEGGPHKKYFPYVRAHADDGLPLVTADDDVIYPPWWLVGLLDRAASQPDTIWAYRARRIRVDGDRLAPYATWGHAHSEGPSVGLVSIGVDGVLFSPAFQRVMRDAGTEFMEHAARADDLWLHVHALRAGILVGQMGREPALFPSLLGSQRDALAVENQVGGRNDAVAAALYGSDDVRRIREALAPVG